MLFNLCNDPLSSTHLSTQTLCRSLAGNKCEMLVITHNKDLNKLPEDGGFVPGKGKKIGGGGGDTLTSPTTLRHEQQQLHYATGGHNVISDDRQGSFSVPSSSSSSAKSPRHHPPLPQSLSSFAEGMYPVPAAESPG
jgi:hypothetical protein